MIPFLQNTKVNTFIYGFTIVKIQNQNHPFRKRGDLISSVPHILFKRYLSNFPRFQQPLQS